MPFLPPAPGSVSEVAIIVLLISGVLAFHAMWVGQLGSGVGIFNGLFLVSAFSLGGIDLFIYIVNVHVELIFQVQYRLNNEEPASSLFGPKKSRDKLPRRHPESTWAGGFRGGPRGTINRIPRCLITRGTPSSYF